MKRTALYNMVEQQIRPWDVHNPALLSVLHELPRADFLPDALKPYAYMDVELPLVLPDGADTHTRLMPPRLLARMVQELDLQGTERTALVGVGDGYLAALLARFSRSLTVFELSQAILSFAQSNLEQAAVRNVQFELNNGLKATADSFDVLVLAGSIPRLTHALLNKIVVGGQMFAIVGKTDDATMHAVMVTRTAEQAWAQKQLFETTLPPLSPPAGEHDAAIHSAAFVF